METRDDGSSVKCNPHPDAPHGFLRNASHNAGRYVCECEFWEPPEEKQKPVGYVSGFYGGYCVIQPTDPAVVLPVGTALYRAPTEEHMSDKEKLAQWMIEKGYATGHGDTIEDLLQELEWQIAEKQEPVAWQGVHDKTDLYYRKPPQADVRPLYTTPQPQEFVCSTGSCRFTLTQTNVGIGERGMQAYEEAKKRGWVGISDE